MTTAAIKPWLENVALHPDVLSENFSEDVFALETEERLDLGTSVELTCPKPPGGQQTFRPISQLHLQHVRERMCRIGREQEDRLARPLPCLE